MKNVSTQLARRNDRPVAHFARPPQSVDNMPDADEGKAPEVKLRQLASDYEAGEIEGILVAYVMGDGEVRYKLMGALAEKENLLNAAAIAGELKKRTEILWALEGGM